MTQQSFINGFIKRASDYGFTQKQAFDFMGALQNGLGQAKGALQSGLSHIMPNIDSGTQQMNGLLHKAIPQQMMPSMDSGTQQVTNLFHSALPSQGPTQAQGPQTVKPPGLSDTGVAGGVIGGTAGLAAAAPKAMPLQPQGIDFKRYHATDFDPKSRMDRFKMQQLQQAQQSNKSLVRAADIPYHGRMQNHPSRIAVR